MPQEHKNQKKLALHLGAVAREARQRAGLTQQEVAERVGIVTEVYGRLERGNLLPRLPTFLRVCQALGLDANPLLGFSSSQPPVWLVPHPSAEKEPPAVRRLLRAVRPLNPRQLTALTHVAGAMLPAPGAPASHEASEAEE